MTYTTLTTSICNLDFYNGTNGYKDNAVTVENLSGRSVTWMANDKFIETKEVKLRLENTTTNPEYTRFKLWYTSTLGGCAGVFTCSALGDGKYWKFTANPSEDAGQKYKEMTFNLEQVYL